MACRTASVALLLWVCLLITLIDAAKREGRSVGNRRADKAPEVAPPVIKTKVTTNKKASQKISLSNSPSLVNRASNYEGGGGGSQLFDLDGLEPTLQWKTEGLVGDYTYEAGVDMTIKNLDSLPYTMWGGVRRKVSQHWSVSGRADMSADQLDRMNLDIRGENKELDVSIRMRAQACAGKFVSIRKLDVRQRIKTKFGRLTLNPRIDPRSLGRGDVTILLDREKDNTSIRLDANADDQVLTFSKVVNPTTRVSPSLSLRGRVSVELEKQLNDGGILTTTLRPNESVGIKWEDGPWTTNVHAPLDGLNIDGVNVGVTRKLDFF
eukprot:scaffold4746_cov53-Attheya_sp.AAC.2